MNKERRNDLSRASKMLSNALEIIASAKELIEQSKDNEQEYFDNMPESLQSGEKGQNSEVVIINLEDALSLIDDFEGAEIENLLDCASE